ncbi:MAG: hypothetical protein JSW64_08145 [Candidatus Zixiibacteriota bacterium]|nr:MAG: hypothetical protein JSW64_08145 [candidate division Zixibacteria bacterium]
MKEEEIREKRSDSGNREPRRIRIPGFISDDDIGLGDVVKKVTTTFGIRPCRGCYRRAAALNRWLVFSPRPRIK